MVTVAEASSYATSKTSAMAAVDWPKGNTIKLGGKATRDDSLSSSAARELVDASTGSETEAGLMAWEPLGKRGGLSGLSWLSTSAFLKAEAMAYRLERHGERSRQGTADMNVKISIS
jgi:hypothetical protein